MRKHLPPDYIFMIITAILVILGLVVLISASGVKGKTQFNDTFHFLKRQLVFGVLIGLLCFLVFYFLPYQLVGKLSLFIFLLFLFLTGLTLLNFGDGEINRWLRFGPLSLQPSEFLKFGLIVYLATIFSSDSLKKRKIFGISPLTKFIFAVGASSAVLLLQPSTGTFVLIFLISLIMIFLAGLKLRYILSFIAIFVIIGVIFTLVTPYRLDRVKSFFNPSSDILGKSYQVNQAKIALGLGGFTGVGLGKSIQKYNYLPETISDSIFAIYAEEFGFVGSLFLLILFLLLVFRGLKIAKGAPNTFSYLAVCGIMAWIIIQAFINIAGISGLIPLSGIPLPFLSYGGSALVSLLTACGFVLNISKYSSTIG